MNNDYIYWTFTAAAQCVATFVALLLTGYALVLSQIEAARDRDDSLQELHGVLRASYHARLKVLAWLTATAVLLSLMVVWDNRANDPASGWVMAVAAVVDVVAMVAGLAFVVTIIDPAKYQKAAERELEHQQQEQQARAGTGQASGTVTSADELFRAFRQLERALREQLRRLDLPLGDREEGKYAGSVRQMANALLESGFIGDELHTELLQLGKYRNLVFHGHVKQADTGMVERVAQTAARVRQLG
jgi:hypothetical protein